MFVKGLGYWAASILLLQLVTVNTATHGQSIEPRIVGGTTANIRTTKYIVKVRSNKRFICGGCLVSPLYVVSAAHCYKGLDAKQLLVIGGATKLSESGVKRNVVKISIPLNFRMSTLHYDLALLKLGAKFTGIDIEPIDLYTGTLNNKMRVQVSGWGFTNEKNNSPSNLLRTINVPIISKSECKAEYRGIQPKLTDSMFCAGQPGVKDSCYGDSGGPAVCNGKLCGIVSWGVGCARPKRPGVYTNVQFVSDFIRKNMV